MNWFDSWGLTLVVFLPVVGMGIVLLLPREDEQSIKVATLLTTLVTLGCHGRGARAATTTGPGIPASSST